MYRSTLTAESRRVSGLRNGMKEKPKPSHKIAVYDFGQQDILF
jgi:hypothetical protein